MAAQQNNRQQDNKQPKKPQLGNKPFKMRPITIIYIVLMLIIAWLFFGGSGGATPKVQSPGSVCNPYWRNTTTRVSPW